MPESRPGRDYDHLNGDNLNDANLNLPNVTVFDH